MWCRSAWETAIFNRIRTLFAPLTSGHTKPAGEVRLLEDEAAKLLEQGRSAEAIVRYRRILEFTPLDAAAHAQLGRGLFQAGELTAAKESLWRAIELDAKLPDAHFLLGQAVQRQGMKEQAVRSFKTAVALKPGFDLAWFELGRAHEELKDMNSALDDYTRALALNPLLNDASEGRARALMQLGRWQDALLIIEKKLLVAETYTLQIQKVNALYGLERFEEALLFLEGVLARHPGDFQALHFKATVLGAIGEHAEAIEIYREVLAVKPFFADALANGGAASDSIGQFEQALDFHERALRVQPDHRQALYNLGRTFMNLGRFREALKISDEGLTFHPDDADLHWNKAVCHLVLGEFLQGWEEFEWRWNASAHAPYAGKPNFPQPMWRGEPLSGKTILLYADQGPGDTLQLLRYLPLLAEMGAKILLNVQVALVPLLGDLGNKCTLVRGDRTPPPFDYYCPLFSLPLAFKTDIHSIPSGVPYIRADPEVRAQWLEKLGPRRGPRIGLVWSDSGSRQNDENRVIPVATLLEGLPVNCQLVSLQNEVLASDMPALESRSMVHAGEALKTLADTAALADCMDLVISVDTSVAHLVGAMGKPLWLILPFNPDWRWLLERDDSPWYPTARLFRQNDDRHWPEVVRRIAAELELALPA